jgi:DNA-binding NarL/FixJ family response regulator
VARVLALVPDLLFGSQLQGSLTAAGHDVELIGDERRLRARLADRAAPAGDVLIFDLTDERLDGAGIRESLAAADELGGLPTLAFFSHVDTATGERARDAGFELVVPRSRIAREGPQLVARLTSEG